MYLFIIIFIYYFIRNYLIYLYILHVFSIFRMKCLFFNISYWSISSIMSYNIIVFGQKNTWSWWGWWWFCSLWWWSMCSWWMLQWKALQNLIHIKYLESPEVQAKQKSRKCINAWPKNGESAIFVLVDCNICTVILWCLNENATS